MTTGAADPHAVAGRIDEPHEIPRSRIDLSRLAPLSRTVTEHVIVASADFGPGAIWVAGGGAEALDEVISRDVQPSFVIGLPVGFAAAAAAKDALRASGLPSLSNRSEKGEAAVAAAAFNALLDAAGGLE